MAAASLATLRSKIEGDLRGRVPVPFTYRDHNVFELVSTGIPEIDTLAGGLPRGAMTEICGAACAGRTSFLLASLASRTADGEVCALVDARDSFDPATAQAAGVALQQLLWVRCHDIDQALRATDLLIQSGGFGLVAIDLSDVPAKTVRQVPLNVWFRFRRAVEDSPTILLVLEQEPNAKTCASLMLCLDTQHAHWSSAVEALAHSSNTLQESSGPGFQPCRKASSHTTTCHSEQSDPAFSSARVRAPGRTARNPSVILTRFSVSSHTKPLAPEVKLLRGYGISSELIRSRIQPPSNKRVINIRAVKSASAQPTIFETQTIWSNFQ